VTLHATDLGVILLAVVAGFGLCYALLLSRLRQIVMKRELTLAEQLGALDDAIRALETRLTEHDLAPAVTASTQVAALSASEQEEDQVTGESESVAPEIQAVIAAAAVAAVGQNATVRSVRSVPQHAVSPWSQQGRALVQGSHNLRVRR